MDVITNVLKDIFGNKYVQLVTVYGIVNAVTIGLVPLAILLATWTTRRYGVLTKRSISTWVLAIIVWFSPSIVTFFYALTIGVPWPIIAILVFLVALGLRTGIKRIPQTDKEVICLKIKDFLVCQFLAVAKLVFKVECVDQNDSVAMDQLSTFRGMHVNWTSNSTSPGREFDQHDKEPTTIHIVVRMRGFQCMMVGYGRVLLGGNQIRRLYTELIGETEINPDSMAEISRLIVTKRILGLRTRGTVMSTIIQLMIYRMMFAVCESYGRTEWYAVMGGKLYASLRELGFPFGRPNGLEAQDQAGIHFLAVMNIDDARVDVQARMPMLYRWFDHERGKDLRSIEGTAIGYNPVT